MPADPSQLPHVLQRHFPVSLRSACLRNLVTCMPQPNTWCLRTPDRTCGRRDLKGKAHLLDVTIHKVGKEKDQIPKESRDVCTQSDAFATQPITLLS